MKRCSLIIIATLAATLLFSTACAPRAEVAPVSTPEPTVSVTAVPTVVPTATPSPVPTPILSSTEAAFSDERRAELDQQIQDFLNYDGEYSKENIQKYLLPGFSKDEFYNLGLVKSDFDSNRVQCWLFDYLEKDNDMVLIAGFENEDHQRFVTLLSMSFHLAELYSTNVGVGLTKIQAWNNFAGEGPIRPSVSNLETSKQYLFKNKPLLVEFVFKYLSDDEAKDMAGEEFINVNRYYRDNLLYTSSLISQIDQNKVELKNVLKLEGKEIPKIETLNDIDELDNSTFPSIHILIISN